MEDLESQPLGKRKKKREGLEEPQVPSSAKEKPSCDTPRVMYVPLITLEGQRSQGKSDMVECVSRLRSGDEGVGKKVQHPQGQGARRMCYPKPYDPFFMSTSI